MESRSLTLLSVKQLNLKTKTGCKTCRFRRLKCDETKPVCKRCIVANKSCEWPISQYYNGQLVADSGFGFRLSRDPVDTSKLACTADMKDILFLAPILFTQARLDMGRKPNEFTDYAVLRSLEMAPFIFSIPNRLGREPALDSAVRCFASALRELDPRTQAYRQQSTVSKVKTLSSYSFALRKLQEALNDPVRSLSAETLCATQMLCSFEAITSENGKGIAEHTKGASRLIQHRGPSRFKSAFELSLLVYPVRMVLIEAYWNNTRSFLNHPEWLQVLKDFARSNPSTNSTDLFMMYLTEVVIPSMAMIPDIIEVYRDGRQRKPGYRERHHALLQTVIACRTNMIQWLQSLHKIRGPPAKDGPDMWPIIYHLSQWCKMSVNRIYVSLGGPMAYAVEQQTQSIATKFLELYRHERHENTIQQSNAMLMLPACNAVMETADEYLAFCVECDASTTDEPMILPWSLYLQWLKLVGLKLWE